MRGRLWELAIPLHTRFSSAAGSVTIRRVVLVEITDGEFHGWGEAAPYPGVTADTVDDVADSLRTGTHPSPSARAALDGAERDLEARQAGLPLWRHLGGSGEPLPTSIAVGFDEDPVRRLEATGAAGVKIKIRPGDDVERVAPVRQAFPGVTVGVDANGSYRWEERETLVAIDRMGVEYVEQPFPADDIDAHARLRDEIGALVAVDETVGSVADATRVMERGAADLVVVKPSRVGVSACVEIHDAAATAGVRIKASGLVETAVGRAHTAAVASLPSAAFSDVAPPGWFLKGRVARRGGVETTDEILLPTAPGMGMEPDPETFAAYVVGESPLGSTIWH